MTCFDKLTTKQLIDRIVWVDSKHSVMNTDSFNTRLNRYKQACLVELNKRPKVLQASAVEPEWKKYTDDKFAKSINYKLTLGPKNRAAFDAHEKQREERERVIHESAINVKRKPVKDYSIYR
jgi:hypothetical protein